MPNDKTLALPRRTHRQRHAAHLVVEEFQVRGALILDRTRSLLRLRRTRIFPGPVGLLISPLVILTVVVSRVKVEVVPESLLALCSCQLELYQKVTLIAKSFGGKVTKPQSRIMTHYKVACTGPGDTYSEWRWAAS